MPLVKAKGRPCGEKWRTTDSWGWKPGGEDVAAEVGDAAHFGEADAFLAVLAADHLAIAQVQLGRRAL